MPGYEHGARILIAAVVGTAVAIAAWMAPLAGYGAANSDNSLRLAARCAHAWVAHFERLDPAAEEEPVCPRLAQSP